MIKLEAFERSPRLSELTVCYRRAKPGKRPNCQSSDPIASALSAEAYLRRIWNANTVELIEEFVIVCLNNANQPLGWARVSSGGFSTAWVDPKVIFAIALQTGSSAILLAHNHPSGNLSPSEADIQLTNRIVEGGRILCIRVLDHIILSKASALSFQDKGLMQESR